MALFPSFFSPPRVFLSLFSLLQLIELFEKRMGVRVNMGTKSTIREAIMGSTNGACKRASAASVGGGIYKGIFGKDVLDRRIVEASGKRNLKADFKN